ncbi:protein diaphanous isoform X2 [Macrosteles quadrilineatus]|uniref:protein diaphanous isoform X2 n=1 Tax=Macrosteles quadrilineatus TaxID=74068 RepID=UPI0023E322ED|nr:protein diaphanous isoform X2 [Macrosteles quadrilineatus]
MANQQKPKSGSFFDTFLGRKKPGSARAGGQLSRPHSDSDFNELDEQVESIEHLDEDALNERFERMLDDRNLTEEMKEPLRKQVLQNKKSMLINHYRGSANENRSKFDKPNEYIQYLDQPDLSINKIHNCLESLRIALTNNPLSWLEEFGTEGLKKVLSTLNLCYRNDYKYDKIQCECLKCLRAIMNNTAGMKQVFSQKEALTIVAQSLDANKSAVMLEAVRVLAAVCLVPPDGHERVLEAITMSGEMRRQTNRFQPIVDALIKGNVQLRIVCLQFINAIVTTPDGPDELEFRLHLRNEIMRAGLMDILDTLEKETEQGGDEQLGVQLKVFIDHKEEDYYELLQRFDNVRLDVDDVNDCFEVVKNLVMDSPAEPYLLSILQHLLFIRDDALIRPAYYKLIEECVSQIVLHRGGCDPDFTMTRRFNIDVQPLIDNLVEKSRGESERRLEEMERKLEEALLMRQEAEAKQVLAEKALQDYMAGGGDMGKGSLPPPPPGLTLGPRPPPPPPMPGGGGPPPPPPPPFPNARGPPPPPMPGMGPPPPPPPPGMGPPPPPMMGGFMAPPRINDPDVLPHGLKPKKKWQIEGLKRANWNTIKPQKLSEKSFWVKVQEEKLASPDILDGLTAKFSSKPPVRKVDDVIDKGGTLKKVKALKVLEAKAAQNLSIVLGGSLKYLNYAAVKKLILQCDTTILSDSVLEQLITYLPPPDQLKRLSELNCDADELTEAEHFAVTLAEIKRLLPRLKSMRFRLHYTEIVQDIKPDIVAATAACEEVKQSRKFAQMLELVLLLGNIMNSGSRNGQAFGFEISYLPKLSSTKDIENKTTLLHYLADTVERKFPELMTFADDLPHIDRAARVSTADIQKTLRQMESNVKNLETDLNNNKVPQNEDDLFTKVMGSFVVEAKQQCALLMNMFQNMETLYKDLSEYYVFDNQKYSLNEFFTDLKMFKDDFYQAHKQNVLAREAEEKSRRAREAREKDEMDRAMRAERKRALVDMTKDGNQEGVMDSLLEALQTGSAFSRDQRRKRQQRPRVDGAERRAQLNRSRSRTGLVSRELSSELIGSA